MGIGTTRIEDRIDAWRGDTAEATTELGNHHSVINAGVLLSIPALYGQGLEKILKTFEPLSKGFYGLTHIVLLMCFMALSRIKSAEGLKLYSPGELGKLLGLDRVPEVGCFRGKVTQLVEQCKCDLLQDALYDDWDNQMDEKSLYYIDGHVRIYTGDKANLPKKYVSRQKLCLPATVEFWVNTQTGLPLLCIIGELTEGLKQSIEQFIAYKISKTTEEELKELKETKKVWFTLVFDREAYEPAWFKKLWDDHRIAIITYRKGVKDKWDEFRFQPYEILISNNKSTMQICEQGSLIQDIWFREVRKLNVNGHQTSIITTHPSIDITTIAKNMLSRWTQENYFKYAIENFDIDYMVQYGTEQVEGTHKVVNPEYRHLDNEIKSIRAKLKREQAGLYQLTENLTIEKIEDQILKDKIEAKITIEKQYKNELLDLIVKRKSTPYKITLDQMPEQIRHNKLKTESKKLKNIIVMLCYRAECAIKNIIAPVYKNTDNDGRKLIQEIFTTDADLAVDNQAKTFTVTLHTLSSPRHNEAASILCQVLTDMKAIYPGTNMRLIYKTHAHQLTKDSEV